MAQLVTAYPKLFSKSPDQELSESVVKVSGNSKFTRLDVREQWRWLEQGIFKEAEAIKYHYVKSKF